MDANLKKALRAISLELRHTLEGTYDGRGDFLPGDLEQRLNAIGVWRDRQSKPLAELAHLPAADQTARQAIDAYLRFRAEAGVGQAEAVAEFVREAAYNWANRLLTMRCLEARGLIDEVVLQKEVYGWRSMVHNRLGQRDPALLAQPDEGLFTVLLTEFGERARELPALFNPKAPAIALRPSLAALKKCIGLLSGTVKAGSYEAAGDELFAAPDALGWAYQYWNAEEKDRVFEKVRIEKGAKIAGADIIPATQLYTEPYMVKFLVQNSLGALWLGMHPDSHLADDWEYYVRDADRVPMEQKPVRDITFLDPACGSGHFHLEAFDLLYAMYAAEAAAEANLQSPISSLQSPEAICAAILNHNLYGIDIDERAIQIAQAALWMKAKEVAWELEPEALTDFHHHFVATNIRLPRGKSHLETFLRQHPEDLPLRPALETVFEGLENAHELGSLLQLEEPVEKKLRDLQGRQAEAAQTLQQGVLGFMEAKPRQGMLPLGVESYDAWKAKTLAQLRAHFEAEAEAADLTHAFFGQSAGRGLAIFDILAQRYDVVAANPPYMGTKNMSQTGRLFLETNFQTAKSDLFGGFFLQGWKLLKPNGKLAYLTLHTWMFVESFTSWRAFLLDRGSLELCAHLGTGTLKDLSNPNAQGFSMQVISKNHHPQHTSTFLNVTGSSEKVAELARIIANPNSNGVFHVLQEDFSAVQNTPFTYAIPSALIKVMAKGNTLGDKCNFMAGISTGNTSRFLRYFWETPANKLWQTCARGGDFSRFYSPLYESISSNIIGIKEQPGARIYKLDWFEQKCIGYTLLSSYGFSARLIEEGAWFERAGNFIFPLENVKVESILAIANSLVSQFILRQLNPTMNFEISDLQRIPYIEFGDQVSDSIKEIIGLKKENSAIDLNSQDFWPAVFSGRSLTEIATKLNGKIIENEFNRLKIQGEIDKQIMLSMGIKDSEIQVMCSVVGTPVWYEEFYTGDLEVEYPSDTRIEKYIYSTIEPNIYEATNTLRESRTTFSDLFSDIISAFTLRLLGHRWPKQIEANEPVPAWAEPSGIIPITGGILHQRVGQASLLAQNGQAGSLSYGVEREFADIVGEKLADWLAGSFFTRHISQFKKRPIAWQLQTSPTPGQRRRGGPAFAALLYYHKLSADLLPTLRNQFVRDLIRAYETEQRTLRHSQSRSDDQEARLRQLEIWLTELQTFSDALQFVSDHGFGDTPALQAALRQYALDDAMQSLKSLWLGRLADQAARDALPDWQTRADQTGIHPALRDWIAAATANLHHHCAQVGASAPQAAKLTTDPDARILAVIIGSQAKEMVTQSLKLAGDAWFSELDANLLRPLLDDINELKTQLTALEEKRDSLDTQDVRGRYEIEGKIKSFKAQIKKRSAERNAHRKAANELRQHIESWRCPAAAGWTDWLGQQPLFDPFASLDGQRQPPQTIAEFVAQESRYIPDINDGVRVNIAPLQKAGLLAADVLAAKDVDKAIADRAEWRADERRWCREGKLPRPGWWV